MFNLFVRVIEQAKVVDRIVATFGMHELATHLDDAREQCDEVSIARGLFFDGGIRIQGVPNLLILKPMSLSNLLAPLAVGNGVHSKIQFEPILDRCWRGIGEILDDICTNRGEGTIGIHETVKPAAEWCYTEQFGCARFSVVGWGRAFLARRGGKPVDSAKVAQ